MGRVVRAECCRVMRGDANLIERKNGADGETIKRVTIVHEKVD